MDKIQYNFTDPNSTMEMTVILQDNGSAEIEDGRIVSAFIAAAAKIAEVHLAQSSTPRAEYRAAIGAFVKSLEQSILDEENGDLFLKALLRDPEPNARPRGDAEL